MKKKIFLIGVSALLLCGCGKIPTLSNGDEAVVKFNDGKMISANDFYEEIKNSYGLNTLLNMIDKYIFEKELDDVLDDANSYAEAYIAQMRNNYETEDEFLQALTSSGIGSIEAYQNSLYLSYLQNEAIEKYVSDNITEDELKKYYDESIYPNMTISHILITPDVTDDMSDEDKEKAESEAKKKAESIIEALKKADDVNAEFTKQAKDNSEDESTKDNGGSLGEINIGSLSGNYDELVEAASKLKDGEFSTEVITTELGYHVILKTKTGDKASYDDSVDSMKESITNDKLSSDASLIADAIKYYRDKYDLDIIDSELDSQYGKYMNNLINTYKNTSSN